LIALVHELDVAAVGDPKNWFTFTMDSQDFALDPGRGKDDELELSVTGLLHELYSVGGL
jgi:hypothetical protein